MAGAAQVEYRRGVDFPYDAEAVDGRDPTETIGFGAAVTSVTLRVRDRYMSVTPVSCGFRDATGFQTGLLGFNPV